MGEFILELFLEGTFHVLKAFFIEGDSSYVLLAKMLLLVAIATVAIFGFGCWVRWW